jgi:hypothetical protein
MPITRCLPSDHQHDGWYLEAGGVAKHGVCLDIMFPMGPDGPIPEQAHSHLTGPQPLQLSFGKWLFLHQEYIDE